MKTSGAAVSRTDEIMKALDLRKRGLTYEEIANQTGVTPNTAFNRVKQGIQLVSKTMLEDAEEVRGMEMMRLDGMLEQAWKIMESGATLLAIDRILKIMERRAKLIGLDAPEEHMHGKIPDNPILARLQKRVLEDPQLRAILADIVLDEVEPSSLGEAGERGSMAARETLAGLITGPGSGVPRPDDEDHRVDAPETREIGASFEVLPDVGAGRQPDEESDIDFI
jgi:hypothetical protein